MQKSPYINQKMYLIDKEVIILKIFYVFHLAEVRYLDSPRSFMVDFNVLLEFPDRSSSISIRLLEGVR